MTKHLLLSACLMACCCTARAQGDGVSRFTRHPTHCTFLKGGAAYIGETATAEFAFAFENAIQWIEQRGATTAQALQAIKTHCDQTDARASHTQSSAERAGAAQ